MNQRQSGWMESSKLGKMEKIMIGVHHLTSKQQLFTAIDKDKALMKEGRNICETIFVNIICI